MSKPGFFIEGGKARCHFHFSEDCEELKRLCEGNIVEVNGHRLKVTYIDFYGPGTYYQSPEMPDAHVALNPSSCHKWRPDAGAVSFCGKEVKPYFWNWLRLRIISPLPSNK